MRSSLLKPVVMAALLLGGLAAQGQGRSIAVLPANVMTNDGGIDPHALAERVQQVCMRILREETSGLEVQDPMTTNARLKEGGIAHTEVYATEPAKLAEALGVDHVVAISLDITNSGMSSTTNEYDRYQSESGRKGDKNTSKGSHYGGSSTNTEVEYQSRLDLTIYKSDGSTLYTADKKALLSNIEAYQGSLKYVLRRSPFGKKGRK